MKPTKVPKSPHEQGRLVSPWRAWLAGAILLLLVTIVYLPTLANGFVVDDKLEVKNNLAIRSLQGLSDIWFKLGTAYQYYPLTYSTFWVEYHLWGLEWRGYHVVNLLLHATSAVLVWRLLLRLAVPGAWLAAAVFAVHPVQVESVAWVSERKNLLSLVLALGSLWAYLRFSPPEKPAATDATTPAPPGLWRSYALAVTLYVAALLAKTVAASVPAVLLVIFWWKRGRVTWRDVGRLVPFFAVGLALSLITLWMEKTYCLAPEDNWNLSPVERVLIAGRALWFYAGKLVWPHPLIFFYPRWVIDPQLWWQYLFPAVALAVLVGLWLARKRIGRGPLAAVLIFAGVLVPALGFFNVNLFRYSFVADHFQYHASIALIALAAAAAIEVASRLPRQARWLGPVAATGLLLPLLALAQQRTYVFKDDMALDEDIIRLDPQSWTPYHNAAVYHQQQRAHQHLGFGFKERGKYDEALSHFRTALEIQEQLARDIPTVSKYQSDVAATYVDVGLVDRKLGRTAEEELSFQKSIEVRETLVRDHPTVSAYQDDLAGTYVNLAFVRQKTGRLTEAEASYRKALEIREQVARDNPGVGKSQNALAGSYVDVGLVQREMGRTAESESSFRKALEIREKLVREHPTATRYQDGLAWCYVDLAFALQKTGRPAEAEASYHKALEIREKLARDNPAVGTYKNNLAASYVDVGIVQRDMGRSAESESSFQGAIAIREKLVRDDPTQRDYQDDLAWCYVQLVVAQYQNGRPAEAESSCRKAIAIREKLVQDHPAVDDYKHQLAVSYRDLGNLQRARGRIAEAVVAYRKAIEIREQLVRDEPTNAAFQSNLVNDLALGGDALALLGNWSQSADLYARAVGAGNYSWQTMWLSALVQLAAGNESGYRATCADLVKRHGGNAAPDAAFSLALSLVVGDQALDDMSPALAIAKRAAQADPANPMSAILVGAAQYRAGRGIEAIATLTDALAQLDPAAPAVAKPDQILVGRLVGAMLLALAYREQADREALEQQLESLRHWIDKTQAPPASPYQSGLPPWAAQFAIEIAKRELHKLSVSVNVPPLRRP